MTSLALTLISVCIAGALWRTRHWGRSRWRWLVWPQVALVLAISQVAYLGGLPLELWRWPLTDKVMHFVLFGLVAFCLNLWLNGRRIHVSRWSLPLAFVVPLVAATLEELLQGTSPHRTMDGWDWLCDVAGMLVFWWLSDRLIATSETERCGSGAHPQAG
jgi:VanZ family protein